MRLRQALESNDLADINTKAQALEQAAQPLAQAVYAQAQQGASPPPRGEEDRQSRDVREHDHE